MSSQVLIAEESVKTKRAREKLKKRLEKLENEITQKSLKRKVIEIHDRISRHAANRVVLTRKSISLFDNNQNSAEISKKISLISEKIKQNNAIYSESLEYLENNLKNHEINIV